MIRFLLLLLLLPGAELVANNTDAVESFASTTLGAQLIMTVTPKTTLHKPLPASNGTANKTSVPHPQPVKDDKKQPSILNPAKVQPLPGGANTSDTYSPFYQQRSSTPFESKINSTKMPSTARSNSLSNSPLKRPIIRKVPTLPNKDKIVPKFTMKNPSARYQSLPHLHHKNVTSKPIAGQSSGSNFTAGSRGLPFSPINQRTVNAPLKNAFKPNQKGVPFPPERVKQFPAAVQAVTQMGRQLKEKSSNTSVLLNTIVNQNSSLLTNSLQHMAQSSNSTFTTGREAVLHELNSLNTQNHLLNSENVTSVPEGDRHNDVSGDGLLRKVNLSGLHDSKVLQKLGSKVNVRIPDGSMSTHRNLSSTELPGLVQEVQFRPELATQPSVTGLTQLATQTARTSDIVSHSKNHSEGLVDAVMEVQSGAMTGVAKSEKGQIRVGVTEGHKSHHNQTHSHKHRHQIVESLNRAEANTISQQNDRPVSSEPNRHHEKHQHNHTQPHSHKHHKHRSDHHLQRNHVSHTLVHLNSQGLTDTTTQVQPHQSNPQQLHTELITSMQNNTHFSTRPSNPFFVGARQENEIGSVTPEGLLAISGTAHPRLTTQTIFDSQSATTTQESTTQHTYSLTNRQHVAHQRNHMEQGRQSEAPHGLHTEPFIHRHSESHTRYNVSQTAKYNGTTQLQFTATQHPHLDLTPQAMDERITQHQSGTHSSQEKLTTPTSEQQTIRNQPSKTFLGLPKLSTSGDGLTTQTPPNVITQTLPILGTQVQPELSTRHVWSEMSTREPPNPTTKRPLIPVTVTVPYHFTESQPEPTRKNPTNSITIVHSNKTQPELFTDNHSKENGLKLNTSNRIELSTNTEPIRNNTLGSSPTQTELITKSRNVFPTVLEPTTEVTIESINNLEPVLRGETNPDSQTEPVTNSGTGSTTTNEPASNTTQKIVTESRAHPIIKSESVPDETDTQRQTSAAENARSATQTEPITNRKLESTSGHLPNFTNTEPVTNRKLESTTLSTSEHLTHFTNTGSITNREPDSTTQSTSGHLSNFTNTRPITDREPDSTTQSMSGHLSNFTNTKPITNREPDSTVQSTSGYLSNFTNTRPITNREPDSTTQSTSGHLSNFTSTGPIARHGTELDTNEEPNTANKMDSFVQSTIRIHQGGDIDATVTNQTELISKISFKPSIPYPHVPTSHKGLIKTTQSDAETTTNHRAITWTGPELSMTTNEGPHMQTERDQAVHVYTPTERTSFTKHANVTEHRTEGSAPSTTGGDHGYTQHSVPDSRTLVWDVGAYPTSGLPSGQPQDHATTVTHYRTEPPSSTKSATSTQSNTFTPQTLGEMMSSPSGKDRIFIVDEQQPVFKVPTISMTYKVNVQHSTMCNDLEPCKKRLNKEVTAAYKYTAGFDRADVVNVTMVGAALEYKVQFGVRLGSLMSAEQELVLSNPKVVFETLPPYEYTLLAALRNASLADTVEPCIEWLSCPRGFRCVPQRKLSAFCLSPCHGAFCQNDGICIHRKGQDPVCQCPVGRDFWYMGPSCDYRMTHHRLAAIACAVVFCIIICAAVAVFILVRRFQTQILQQKVAQTQSSYRRFSRFDDVPTHFWCPSQTWLTTSASINSLDNPAFSSSEEVFPLQALGSCVCGCQDGARNNAPANPAQQPSRAPPRLETSCSSVNDLMVDSGKASDVSVCSWPMEPIHWTPFPILHQLSLQSPFHARRPHSYFEGMELVNTERSWTA